MGILLDCKDLNESAKKFGEEEGGGKMHIFRVSGKSLSTDEILSIGDIEF